LQIKLIIAKALDVLCSVGHLCLSRHNGTKKYSKKMEWPEHQEEMRHFGYGMSAGTLKLWSSSLPLDLQAELYLRSDRTAIAYRKRLRELGLTFGTA
jgi:hypothetical protein